MDGRKIMTKNVRDQKVGEFESFDEFLTAFKNSKRRFK